MIYGMKFNECVWEIGFCDGDIFFCVDEKLLECFGVDMFCDIVEVCIVIVLCDGKEVEVYMFEISLLDIVKDDLMFVMVLVFNVVDLVILGGGLDKVGI